MTAGMDGWGEYKLLVVDALERLDRHVEGLRRELVELRKENEQAKRELSVDIAALREKSRAWGALGGAIVSALAALAWMLAKGP